MSRSRTIRTNSSRKTRDVIETDVGLIPGCLLRGEEPPTAPPHNYLDCPTHYVDAPHHDLALVGAAVRSAVV